MARKRKGDALRRWNMVSELIKIVIASGRVTNIAHRVNAVLVAQPGRGKTTGLFRALNVPGVRVASDLSPKGVDYLIQRAHAGRLSTVIIPDLGPVVNRKYETARQTMSMLSSACSEGVHEVLVGRRFRDFKGAGFNLLAAVTTDDLEAAATIILRSGFTSRMILVDLDLTYAEVGEMWERRHIRGDNRHLRPLKFGGFYKGGKAPFRKVVIPRTHLATIREWWDRMHDTCPQFVHGFRTPEMLTGLIQGAAYLRGSARVTAQDVAHVERLETLWTQQVHIVGTGERPMSGGHSGS